MKLLTVLIFGFLVAGTLGQNSPSKPSGPPPKGPPRRPPRPPPASPQNREDDKEKGVGWGWSSPGWGSHDVLPDPNYVLTPCVDPSTIVSAAKDPDFFSRPRLWYVTGSTKYFYIMNERIFNGHYPQSQEEMNQMCFARFDSLDAQINSGFGVQFTQNFIITDNGDIYDEPINTDPSTYDGALGVDISAAFNTPKSYLVANDNQTYAILYYCVDGLYGSIELLTTRPHPSPEAVGAFVEQAKTYGYPRDQLQLLQCSSAFQGPYRHPFENYPNGWSSGNGWSNNSTGWGSTPSNGWNSNSHSNGWNSNPQPSGWNSNPQLSGWNSNPQPSGWNSNPQPSGWNSNPQPSGWNSQPNGWSGNHNNGWLVEKQAEVKEESQKVAEPKSKSERKFS